MSSPNWSQLLYDAAHLTLILGLVLLFLLALSSIAGRNLRDLYRFLRRAFRGEFTEKPGWLNLVMFFLYLIFILTPSITEQILAATRLTHLAADTRLFNSNVKIISTTVAFISSLVYVGLRSPRNPPTKRDE